MLPEIERRLLDAWPSLFAGVAKPPRLRFLNACGSIEGGTTTFLAFPTGAGRPVCAVKVNRADGGDEMLRREAALLASLETFGSLRGSVPRVLLSASLGGHQYLVQSILPGEGMAAPIDSAGRPLLRDAERRFSTAAAWLTLLNRATVDRSAVSMAAGRERLLCVAERFCAVFVLDRRERLAVEAAVAAVDRVLAPGVVVQHGDFSRHNILIDAGTGSFGVIDWTYARAGGLALYDLLSFAATYFLQSGAPGAGGRVGAFESTFVRETPLRRVVKSTLDRYCADAGMADADPATHLIWFLMERAMFEHALITAAAARGAYPRGVLGFAGERAGAVGDAGTLQIWIELFRAFVPAATEAA